MKATQKFMNLAMRSPNPYGHCFWRQDLCRVIEFKDITRMMGFKVWSLVALVQGVAKLCLPIQGPSLCCVARGPSQKPTNVRVMVLKVTASRTKSQINFWSL